MTMAVFALGLGAATGAAIAAAMIAVRRGPATRGPKPIDPAVVAAIAAAVSSLHPGARVMRIEGE